MRKLFLILGMIEKNFNFPHVLDFTISEFHKKIIFSTVILGIVLSNLFFGYLSDRVPIHPILRVGGFFVAAGGVICAMTNAFSVLVGARIVQGILIPAHTTSLAAWMSKNLPQERLSVVMGTYFAATVLGGLGGRLLGGWIHPPLHWRYAFISAAALIIAFLVMAVLILPADSRYHKDAIRERKRTSGGLVVLLTRKDLVPFK